ncbi:MAG: hypothetical protein WCK01_04290 [Candidatus Uhrbacteria bacterium]
MKRTFLIAPLLTIALFGFGCKSTEAPAPQIPNAVVPNDSAPVSVPVPTSTTPVGVSPDVLYARQVLRNLSQANSFRASMKVPTANGRVATNLEYSRTGGLSGSIEIPGDNGATQTANLFANDSEIWFRQGTTTWQNLSNTEDGKNFQAVFQNAFNYQNRYQSTVADTATLTSKTDDPVEACSRYAFNQPTGNGGTQTFTLCVKADLPVYLTIDGPFGQIEVHYRDINGNVEVKRPV